MEARRGDPALLAHPVAQHLLQATIPVRLAYLARDGTPRVVTMRFLWTGEEVVVGCFPDDPKVAALQAHHRAALTIDTCEPPYRALQIRGTAAVTQVDTAAPEFLAIATRYADPEAGRAWVEQAVRLSARSARIAVRPDWVDVLDFETRLPGGLARRLTGPPA